MLVDIRLKMKDPSIRKQEEQKESDLEQKSKRKLKTNLKQVTDPHFKWGFDFRRSAP